FFQDFALHLQPLVLAAQTLELLVLVRRQRPGVALAGVYLGATHPIAQRRLREVQVLRDLPDRPVADRAEAYGFGLELGTELPALPSRHRTLPAHARAFRGVHGSGGGSLNENATKARRSCVHRAERATCAAQPAAAVDDAQGE